MIILKRLIVVFSWLLFMLCMITFILPVGYYVFTGKDPMETGIEAMDNLHAWAKKDVKT